MKTYYVLAMCAFLLSACASVAPSQFYRPANYSGTPWAITGQYNDFTQSVEISVNGQNITHGHLSFFLGNGEFSGEYEGKPVQVSCVTSIGFFENRTTCQVFVSGERAANLTF